MIWTIVAQGFNDLLRSWFDTKRAKQDAEAEYHRKAAETEGDWDNIALRQSQYSWKDEFITLVWFSPLIVAWFEPVRARAWVTFVGDLPIFYQFGMFGILAASMGLRWYFKRQNFNLVSQSDTKKM